MRFLAVFFLALPLLAQKPDPAEAKGTELFYNLDYDEAIAEFSLQTRLHPDLPELFNDLAKSILFREMLRNGALESELVSGNNSFLRRPKMNPTGDIAAQFQSAIETASRLAQQRLQSNPKDTRAMYTQGITFGLRSNYDFLVRKAWRDSLRDATSARKLHNKVAELEPNNIDVRLAQGVHDYIVGSLPFAYRMLGFVIGFHGDRDQGIRTIQRVAREGKYNREDAEFFLCALYRREYRMKDAIPLLQDLVQRFPRNYLLRFELSQMYSQAGDGKSGIAEVRKIAALKQSGAPGYTRVPWEKIWLQEGTIQFWYREFDASLANMQRVVASTREIDLNDGVHAWMRIGQIHDLSGRRPQALQAYRKAIDFAPQAEAANDCRRYLTTPYRRK